jgi:hypothetical protein
MEEIKMTLKHKLSAATMGLAAILEMSAVCHADTFPTERMELQMGIHDASPRRHVNLTSISSYLSEERGRIYLNADPRKQKTSVFLTLEDWISHHGTPAGRKLELEEPLQTRNIIDMMRRIELYMRRIESYRLDQSYCGSCKKVRGYGALEKRRLAFPPHKY